MKQLQTAVIDIKSSIVQQSEALPHASSGPYHDFSTASISALTRMISDVERTHKQASTNKHLETPQPVDRFYTGRDHEANQLADWLFEPLSDEKHEQKQRRFVVYGVGGSGKTQFCCKFADDNRER